MLFGDLLISRKRGRESPLSIPGVGSRDKIEFPEFLNIIPTGFKQKVCLLNNCLAVAWAGKASKAFTVIRELSALHDPITIDSITNFFAKVPIDKDVCFIVLGLDMAAKRQFVFKHGPAWQWETSTFGGATAAGSGVDHLKISTELMQKMNFTFNQPSNDLAEMISKISALTSMLLVQGFNLRDLKTQGFPSYNTIRNLFGGGYEVVFNKGGKLCKLKNICYVFWVAYGVSNNEIHLRQEWKIFYYTYLGDLLFLRALHIRPTASSNLENFNAEEDAIYIIEPLLKYYSKDELARLIKNDFKLEFKPDIFVHYIVVFKKSDGSHIPLNVGVQIEFTKPNEKPKFNIIGNSLVDIDPKLYKEIGTQAKEIYSRYNPPTQ